MVHVAILGASGYTALELMKILLRHPEVKIVSCVSRQEECPWVHDLHPILHGQLEIRCESLDVKSLLRKNVKCVFSCLPHGASMDVIPEILKAGIRIVDLSADYRLKDPVVYKKWYGEDHKDLANLSHAVYGLPEFLAGEIQKANLVANPGCYPQTAILGLAPLLGLGLVHADQIIIDSKSGVSGAGRNPKQNTHFPECNESVSAYQVGKHRHTPEMIQALVPFGGKEVDLIFTPHLIPMDRGIFSAIYAKKKTDLDKKTLIQKVAEFYSGKPFVRVLDKLPATKDCWGTNFISLNYEIVNEFIICLAVLDNLVRGASGVAVQNMNIMFGFPEKTGF